VSGVAEFWEVRPRIKGSYSHSLLSLSPSYFHTLLCVAPCLHTLLCQSPHTFIHYCASRHILSYIIEPIASIPSYIIEPVAPYLHTLLCQSPHTFIHYWAYRLHTFIHYWASRLHTFIHYWTSRPIPSYIIVPVAPYLHTLLSQSPYTFIHSCASRPIPSYTCFLTYLLTYSVEQSPSWEAIRFSASQEIPRILWNPTVHYCIHKCPPLVHLYTLFCLLPLYLYTLLYPSSPYLRTLFCLLPPRTFVLRCDPLVLVVLNTVRSESRCALYSVGSSKIYSVSWSHTHA
jgi:hypothetical protein